MKHTKGNIRRCINTKLKNKRLSIIDLDEDGFMFDFKIMDGNISPRSFHEVHRDKIVETRILLSNEASEAIFWSLAKFYGYKKAIS